MKINGQTISSDQSFRSYVDNIEDITTGAKLYNNSDEMIHDNKGLKDEDLSIIYNQTSSTNGTFDGIYQYSAVNNNWSPAPTQYLATDDDVMAVSYFGANGSSVGTFNAMKYYNSSNFNDIKNTLNKYSDLYNTIDTTNMVGIGTVRSVLANEHIINYLNIQNVTTFWNMFWNMYNLKYIDNVSNWNTSIVNNMSQMFYGCNNLVCINGISNWDVSNVTNMSNMFDNCRKLQFANYQIFSNWNVSNVTNMSGMFRNCKLLFEHNSAVQQPNFINWNVSNVTNMSDMFDNCKEVVGLYGFNNKDASKVTNATNMFRNCKSLNSFAASSSSSSFGLNMCNLINASNMFADCTSLITLNIMNNISKIQDASSMFAGCTSLVGVNINLNSGNVEYLTNMFAECKSLSGFNVINITSVKSMANMFRNCKTLNSTNSTVYGIKGFKGNTSNVRSMENMYFGCTNITTMLPMTLNTINVVTINNMFYSSGITNVPNTFWNLPNVNGTLYGVFTSCPKLTEINLSGAFMPNVTTFNSSFFPNNSFGTRPFVLTNAKLNNLSKIETFGIGINAIYAQNLYAPNLKFDSGMPTANINLANAELDSIRFNPLTYGLYGVNMNFKNMTIHNKPTNMYNCFSIGGGASSSLEYLDMDYELTSEVTNMSWMFFGCRIFIPKENGVEKVMPSYPYFVNFNTSKVTNMSCMFYNSNIGYKIPNYNTINVTNTAYMFSNCDNANFTDIPNFDMSNVKDASSMFRYDRTLENIPELNFVNATNMVNTFLQCSNLTSASYENIANGLPNANQLTNQYLINIGLNVSKFSADALAILNQKGYIDATI